MSHRFRTAERHNTTARGYGAAHQAEVARRRQATTPAHRCGYCGQPLGPERLPGDKQSRWALPHNAARTGYLPGLWHKRCNDTEGASRGARIVNARRRGVRVVRRRSLL